MPKGIWNLSGCAGTNSNSPSLRSMALVAILSFSAWFRDRRQWLLFWTGMFATSWWRELFLGGLRLHDSFAVLICLDQIEIAIREMSLWFLLLWLLQLQDNRKLVVLTRKAALISVTASTLDGLLIFLYPFPLQRRLDAVSRRCPDSFGHLFRSFFPYACGLCFPPQQTSRLRPLGGRHSRILQRHDFLCAEHCRPGTSDSPIGTLADKITAPLFNFADNPITPILLFRTLLFFSIVYAVIRYSIDNRRRTIALEQEYQSARELQRVLVPSSLPVIPGFTLTSAYRPAQQVGGDFFQIIPLEGGSTLVILGDVSGKGLMAAMAVSLIVGAVRALADDYPRPARLAYPAQQPPVRPAAGGLRHLRDSPPRHQRRMRACQRRTSIALP